MRRRSFLQGLSMAAALLLMPLRALAAAWNQTAFKASDIDGAIRDLGIAQIQASTDILITAPDRAENGAVVQIEVTSNIPATESISIFAEKNPTPLIAEFRFSNGAEPFVITRIKMADTANVVAIVKAGGHYYRASRQVEVLEDGCN